MKSTILFLAATAACFAQPATPPVIVKGEIAIKFNTRTGPDAERPRPGSTDTYAMAINVANSALFKGIITARPYIRNLTSSNQTGQLTYELDCDVINPANPSQTRNIGRIFGTAPVDNQNIYRFADGNVKVAVFGVGAAKGFESRFNGLALGKPPAASGLAKMKQEAVRLVSSKGGAITLTKYDKMEFQNLTIPAGPVQIYPEATITGTLFYDYGRSAWHFNNVNITYRTDGRPQVDILTGNIRWVEHPNRKANGEGRYDFDIRVNEPAPSEAAVFAGTTDEAAFFAADDTNPALTGTMAYKDSLSNGTVVASNVTIDLKGTKLSKQQVMNLAKLLFLTAVVPLNAE